MNPDYEDNVEKFSMAKLTIDQYTDLDKLRHSCAHVLAQAVSGERDRVDKDIVI